MSLKQLLPLLIFLTFTLINLGGYVHNTGSSLACPDWPLCHNQLMPEMRGGVLIEHSHRLLATLIGFLTLITVIIVKKDSKEATVSYTALIMVVIQGLLGGLTVIFKLPPLISTAHLGLSLIFFCTLIYLHHLILKPSRIQSSLFFKKALGITLLLLYFQIILGAFIRHKGFGTACGLGFNHSILCSGQFLPGSLSQNLHMFHRFLGLIVGLCVISLNVMIIKINKQQFYLLPVLTGLIIIMQIVLGIITVATALRPTYTMLHLGGAALSLGLLWKINLKT
ncbi:MAG: COX15/CtaA family protein [Bacteriovoracaceae bacterium]|nr:COX15/CtaA family protein [Bacteriovoracaceae bacterium]